MNKLANSLRRLAGKGRFPAPLANPCRDVNDLNDSALNRKHLTHQFFFGRVTSAGMAMKHGHPVAMGTGFIVSAGATSRHDMTATLKK